MEQQRLPTQYKFDYSPHVLIVEGRFYDDIGDMLLKGAIAELEKAGTTHEIITVPGAFEIPAAIMYGIKSLDFDPARRRYNGYVALGCVLKGDTMHDEIVAHESARGLQDVIIHYSLAAGNGILTCNTREQAVERADPAKLNRGGAAASACLHMMKLKEAYNLAPRRRWFSTKRGWLSQ